jgi:hypothetical protein
MTTSRTRTHRKKKIAAATAALIVGGSGAFAFWSSMGAGTGSVSTGTSTPFTVTAGAAAGGALTPGGPAQTVPFTVTNPGTGSQNLAAVTVTVAGPAGTSGTVTVTMNNLTTNQDACKNATVPLYFSAR